MHQLLAQTYTTITGIVDALAEEDFERRTRAEAWTVKELLLHQSMDAIRALAAFATTTEEEPDVDSVTYWHRYRPDVGDGGAAHAGWIQRSAAAYDGTEQLVGLWQAVSIGAARAAAAADPRARVTTQGLVLTVPDFISTLVLEAAVHHLDLILELPGAPGPPAPALREVRRVLEALLGSWLPSRWDDTEAALKGTGRLPLSETDRQELGPKADRLPVLG